MKILALLFSLYVAFLVSLPCKDGESCAYDVHTGPVHHHDQSGSQELPDGCSPFCVCSCCSVTVIITSFHLNSIPFEKPFKINIPLTQNFISDYIPHFWQPPKIG